MAKTTLILTCIFLCCAGMIFPAEPVQADEPQFESVGISPSEILRLGERMYRNGIPSGTPAEAIAKSNSNENGSVFSCESCHMRGGIGATEAGVVALPINGATLFQPKYYGRELTSDERSRLPKFFQTPPVRPAYTDETLAIAIRDGIDPTGKVLNAVMPRYLLDDRNMKILSAYLKTLSANPSPGVTDTTIRFATVISEEVLPEDQAVMLGTLEAFVADWNSQAKIHEARARSLEIARDADLSYRRISLARWELKGPPATWRNQLEEYLRKEPVFALLGGITTEEWKPIHEFSEDHRIPCIFPITDFPVISDSDWYTLYFSKGLNQEGETAARALGRAADFFPEEMVLQISRDTKEGRALSSGFEGAWQELGRKPPVNWTIQATASLTKELIQQLTDTYKPSVILLWMGAEAVPALAAIAEVTNKPRAVYMSSSILRQSLWTLPESVRLFTLITYPYQIPREEALHANYAKTWLQKKQVPVNERRISTRMYSVMFLMTKIIPRMKRNFYRDHFLDIISLSEGHGYPDFERFSFAPGQRYVSKGSYIVELSRGPKPTLLRIGDLVVH